MWTVTGPFIPRERNLPRIIQGKNTPHARLASPKRTSRDIAYERWRDTRLRDRLHQRVSFTVVDEQGRHNGDSGSISGPISTAAVGGCL